MKHVILTITLILSMHGYAQNKQDKANAYVRVYSLEGKIIHKGKILFITETSLHLANGDESENIPVSSIGTIKTKRSPGSNILIGSASGAIIMAIIGATTAEPDEFLGYTSGEGAAGGALIGGVIGAGIGGLSLIFKKSKTFEINGDLEKWKSFTKMPIK